MPIFEYICEECENTFEKLVLGDEHIDCPACHSSRISKQFSRFGLSKSANGPYESLPIYKGGGCGCTPSGCGCKN